MIALSPARRRLLRRLLLALIAVPLALVLLTRLVPPPLTPLMLIRLAEGFGLHKHWEPLERISPHLARAVIASEDARFCSHHGFDWHAIDNAIDTYQDGGRLRGASTISQQTAKNAFLWPGRSFLRKGLEAGFTVLIEALWGKRRIMEVYLNIIEWGPGLYGAEAAAQTYFHKPAAALSWAQAAALAAVLPSPLRWSPNHPDGYVARRIHIIEMRMAAVRLDRDHLCP